MRVTLSRSLILAMSLALSSCGLFTSESPESSEVKPSVGPDGASVPTAVVPAQQEEGLNLQVAKLNARVAELESHLLQQRERMALIEKGLMLGIVPEELKKKDWKLAGKSKRDLVLAESSIPESESAEVEMASKKPSAEPMTKSKDVAEYRRLVQQAQDKFNSANYGQAIAIFNDIGDKFDDSLTEGSHHYWVGLGWFYLKENQLAEQSLTQIRDKYPQNRWVPYAKFYLAKIDQLRGLHNRALDQMRKLMEEFPQQDIGEMAKLEVQKMRDSF